MPNAATIDDREFQRTMLKYKHATGKDMAAVADGKLRDWMFKSAREAPKAEKNAINRVIENPRFISWYTSRRLGGRGWTEDDWKDSVKMLRRRRSSIGYGKSGFVKAANMLKDTGSRPGKAAKVPSKRFRRVRAKVRRTKDRNGFDASARIDWAANSGSDLFIKQNMARTSLRIARRAVVVDTRKYLKRKAQKQARAINNQFRGVAKAFA